MNESLPVVESCAPRFQIFTSVGISRKSGRRGGWVNCQRIPNDFLGLLPVPAEPGLLRREVAQSTWDRLRRER